MHIKAEHGQKGTGVEVILDSTKVRPHCNHGPALLFERFSQNKDDSLRFFACSAYRSRKECSLYVLEEKPWSETKLKDRISVYEKERVAVKWYIPLKKRSEHVQMIRAAKDQMFCKTCNCLIVESDENSLHDEHTVVKAHYKSVTNPTTLLNALTSNQGNAQYIFAEKSSKFFLNLFVEGAYSHVLCVGTPRIHEIVSTQAKKISSMLLDLDDRFIQFYPPTAFQHYNLSVNYFFEKHGKKYFEKFVKNAKKVAIFIDPPFGAMAPVISDCLDKLKADIAAFCGDVSVTKYWIYPHFLSKHIHDVQPDLKMCHFPIEYNNHPVFKAGNSYTKSPVRVFTDRPLSEIVLAEEDFKLCKKCTAWVGKDTVHCKKCRTCPQVNRATRHCDQCTRCVAVAYVHCSTCIGCRPDLHHCKPPSLCHRCKQPGHKRMECPKVNKANVEGNVEDNNTENTEGKPDTKDGYFTIYSAEERQKIRSERKRKNKENKKAVKKKAKID